MRDRDIAIIRRLGVVTILIMTAIPTGLRRPRFEQPQWKLFPVDFVLNTILYMPFGFGLGNMTLGGAIRHGAILSALIEGLQMFYRGRYAMIMDVIANTAGTGIGALSFRFAQRFTLPARTTGRSDIHSTVLLFGSRVCRAPRQQIPVLSSAFADPGHVVGQQVTFFHERNRGFLDQFQIVLARRIALLNREARIARLL